MSTIRYGNGEVRLVWRLLIIILLFVAVAFLLRFIPICLYTAFLAHSGVAQEDALARAKAIVFEDPAWSTAVGILNGLMSLPLVWLVVGVIERRLFTWKTVGLDWRRSSLSALAGGALLALILYVLDKVVALALGASMPSVNVILAGLSIPVFIQTFVLYVAMGFGEEVVFRGYVQTRLVERYGVPCGILLASVTFTLLHIGFRPLPPVTIVSGVVLWAAVGVIYQWSKSLYLVGMFHGMANTLLNTFHLEGTDIGGLLMHVLVLVLVVVPALRRSAVCRADSNST